MPSYPAPCPHCPIVVDSQDSQSDSEKDLAQHILVKHPETLQKVTQR